MRSTVLFLAAAACTGEPDAPRPAPQAALRPALELRFVPTIAAAGVNHTRWPRVSDELRAAPIPCAAGAMRGETEGRVRISDAPESPHHRKLYYLRSSNNFTYASDGAVEAGFMIVKEAFLARPAPAPASAFRLPGHIVRLDDRWWTTGDPAGLFVMVKVGATEGSDAGWIYGTISVDGKVTSAGRVATCAGCHEDATHERLFGPPDS